MISERIRGLGIIWRRGWGFKLSWTSIQIKTPLVVLYLANGARRPERISVWWGFLVMLVRQWPPAKPGGVLGPNLEIIFRMLRDPGLSYWQEWCCGRGVWVKLVPENDETLSHSPVIRIDPGAEGFLHGIRSISEAREHTTIYFWLNSDTMNSVATVLLQSKAHRRTPADIAARICYRLKKRFSRQSISLDAVKRSD